MSDEKPTDVPPWLRVVGAPDLELTGAVLDVVKDATFVDHNDRIACEFNRLPEWLRWRSELAAALGLMEPAVLREKMLACRRGYGDERAVAYNAISDAYEATFGEVAPVSANCVGGVVPPAEFFLGRKERQAVAAELRAQADAIADVTDHARANTSWGCGAAEGRADAIGRLRARADELDPPAPAGPPLKPVLTLQATTGNVSELLSDPRAVWSNPGGPAVTVTIGSADDPTDE